MGPKTTELHDLLLRMCDELEKAGNAEWSQWLLRDAELLEQGDFGGVEHFLGSFGSFGGLNDLNPPSAAFAQDLELAWRLAKEIEREVRLSD